MSDGWVPAAFRDSDDPANAAAAAGLVEETNRVFGDLGISAEAREAGDRKEAKDVRCRACGEAAVGRVVEALGGSYHPRCFVCVACDKPFAETGEGFVPRGDGAVCAKCVSWERKEKAAAGAPPPASSSSSSSSSSSAKTSTAASASAEANQNIQAGKEACGRCGKALMGFGVEDGGATFHPECFRCDGCGGEIGMDEFVRVDGKPYHQPCAVKRHGTACTACGKQISGKFVRAEGKPYHKECFTCAACKGSLAAGYVMRDGAPLCGSCVSANRQAPASSRTVAAQGIRVDPRSGKVRAAEQPASAAKKFCTDCGTPTQAGARFCGGCGATL